MARFPGDWGVLLTAFRMNAPEEQGTKGHDFCGTSLMLGPGREIGATFPTGTARATIGHAVLWLSAMIFQNT